MEGCGECMSVCGVPPLLYMSPLYICRRMRCQLVLRFLFRSSPASCVDLRFWQRTASSLALEERSATWALRVASRVDSLAMVEASSEMESSSSARLVATLESSAWHVLIRSSRSTMFFSRLSLTCSARSDGTHPSVTWISKGKRGRPGFKRFAEVSLIAWAEVGAVWACLRSTPLVLFSKVRSISCETI